MRYTAKFTPKKKTRQFSAPRHLFIVLPDFNYGPVWPGGLVPRKQAVVGVAVAQRPQAVAVVEVARRLQAAAVVGVAAVHLRRVQTLVRPVLVVCRQICKPNQPMPCQYGLGF